MPDIYSAGDVIDKSLFSLVPITVYSNVPKYLPPGKKMDDYKLGTVPAKSWVGVVDSYVNADPTKGQSNLWWVFYPASNFSRAYYAEHKPGIYDVKALNQQGVLSLEDKQKAADEANKSWLEKLGGKLASTAAIVGFGILAVYAISQTAKSKSNE